MQMALNWGKQYWGSIKHWASDHSHGLKKTVSILFFCAIAYLLVSHAKEIEWAKVFEAMRETDVRTLLIGFVIGFLCYTAYAAYDLFGRHLLKLRTSAVSTMLAAWISYACNLNLGAIIGSIALRYRLYSRLGVSSGDVTKVIGISVTNNWLGYCLLAGGLFASGSVDPPGSWVVGKMSLQFIGAALLLVVGIYLYFCFFADKREYQIKNKTVTLPPAKIVVLQFGLACIHWTLMAATIYQFMPEALSFPTVYAVLLVSCVAGAVSHVPGGLGVLEAVFVALLAGDVPKYQLIAGVFAYRCVFYLAPLIISLPLYLAFESFYGVRRNTNS
jgi:uncharacterized membrane protein YbhN (UPF0104 family)